MLRRRDAFEMSHEMANNDTAPPEIDNLWQDFAKFGRRSYADVVRLGTVPATTGAMGPIHCGDPTLMDESYSSTVESLLGRRLYSQAGLVPVVANQDNSTSLSRQDLRFGGINTYAEALHSPSASATMDIAGMPTPSLSYTPATPSRSDYTKSRSRTSYSYGSSRTVPARRSDAAAPSRPQSTLDKRVGNVRNRHGDRRDLAEYERNQPSWVPPGYLGSLPNRITNNPNFRSEISEPLGSLQGWVDQPRVAQDRLIPPLDTLDPNPYPTPPTSASSGGLMARRTKRQRLDGSSRCQCHVCQAGFDTNSDLKHHMRSHTPNEARPHACTICSKRFLYPKDLHRHSLVHESKRLFCPHRSCLHATKGFSRKDHLDRHLQSQHPVDSAIAQSLLPGDFGPSAALSSALHNPPPIAKQDLKHQSSAAVLSADDGPPWRPSDQTPLTLRLAAANNQERMLDQRTTFGTVQQTNATHMPSAVEEDALHNVSKTAVLENDDPMNGDDSVEGTLVENQQCVKTSIELERPQSLASSPVPESSFLDSVASNTDDINAEHECHCRPEECHASTCPPEEPTYDRMPDIRKLLAFLARRGSQQTTDAGTSQSQDSTTDTAALIQQIVVSFRKREWSEDREDNRDDSSAPKKARTATTPSSKEERKFKCPVAADCMFASASFTCSCCKWRGSARFCDVRLHIERTHFDITTGQFRQHRQHTTSHATLAGLDLVLRQRENEQSSPAEKWRSTYRYLYSMPATAETPSPFLDATIRQRVVHHIVQSDNELNILRNELMLLRTERDQLRAERAEQDLFHVFDSLIDNPTNAMSLDEGHTTLQPAMVAHQQPLPPVMATFETDATTTGFDGDAYHGSAQTTTLNHFDLSQVPTSHMAGFDGWQGNQSWNSSRDTDSQAFFSLDRPSVQHVDQPAYVPSILNLQQPNAAQATQPRSSPLSVTTTFVDDAGNLELSSSQDEESNGLFSGDGSSVRYDLIPGSSMTSTSHLQQTGHQQARQPRSVPIQDQSTELEPAPPRTGLTSPSAIYSEYPFDFSNVMADDYLTGFGAGPAQSSPGVMHYPQQIDTEFGPGKDKGKRKR